MYGLILSLIGVLLYMYMPIFWLPIWYLAPIAMMIKFKQYEFVMMSIISITLLLQMSSITSSIMIIVLYGIWVLGIYISYSLFDKSSLIQGIIAGIWFSILIVLFKQFNISYVHILIQTTMTVIWTISFLKISDYIQSYEKIS
jgi:hypothetical protein